MVERKRQEGFNILFISDMHLPHHILENILINSHIMHKGQDKLYVSSELLKTKHTGNLYKQIRSDYNNIEKWYHYGDNYRSDYLMAKKNNIKAYIIKPPIKLHYTAQADKYELNYIQRPFHLISAISSSIYHEQQYSTYDKVIIDIIAPLFISHTVKILSEAQSKGITQLLFLARDSYMFYLIAKQFTELFPQINLIYIYVSRRTIYLPSIETICAESFLQLKDIKNLSIEDYLDQFGIDIKRLRLPNNKRSQNTKDLLKEILRDEHNILTIKKLKERATSSLIAYLNQCTNNQFHNTAMVDMSGSRSSQEAFNNIFQKNDLPSIFSFYFLVSEDRKSIKDAGEFSATLYADFLKHGSFHCIGDLTLLFEDVFSVTNQNRTIGYTCKCGKTEPIFDSSICKWKETIMQKNIDIFNRYIQLYKVCNAYRLNHEILLFSIKNIASFATNPLHEYVKSLRDFHISENANHQHKIIAKPWDKDFKKAWFRGSIIDAIPFSNVLITLILWIKKKQTI